MLTYRKILVALDGSEPSVRAGRAALAAAVAMKAQVVACHVYGARLHRQRFAEMEPGLPDEYQDARRLDGLRAAHDTLIARGFQALSDGYLDDFVAAARTAGVAASAATAEGRNYVRLLELAARDGADLVALGADGLGAVGDGLLGSTAARVLAGAPCDVLLARGPLGGGPVLAGVDGSPQALQAAARAAAWAHALGRPLRLVAAYDPEFHGEVFRAMARTLSAGRSEEVGLAAQEELHDRIINDGLASLYRGFLDEAARACDGAAPAPPETSLVAGKAYRALAAEARACDAALVVVGRHGHHDEPSAAVGSQADALARTCPCSVLIAAVARQATGEDHAPAAGDARAGAAQSPSTEDAAPGEAPAAIEWDADALARLERVPPFVRPMARRAVEQDVLARGGGRVTQADFDDVARRFGMGGGPGAGGVAGGRDDG
jgi:nucleotide-binding universal stress UspA family protein